MAKKYLDDNGLLYFWGKLKLTFALISHTHTKSQITDFPATMPPTSHTHGNITNAGALQSTDITIATGDKIVVTDGSNSSKVARTSLAFDTATEGTDKKALTQAGTWQTFLTAADVPEGASASTTTPKALGADNHPDGYVGAETAFARGDHVHPLSPVFTAATASENGKAGLVPATTTTYIRFLTNGGNLWKALDIRDKSSSVSIINNTSGNDSNVIISLKDVDKTAGTSGLMSASDKTKLDGIATGAEANVLEGVQVNGTDLTITNKKVNVPVFTGATTSAAGTVGLVPAPSQKTYPNYWYLCANGSWNLKAVQGVSDTTKSNTNIVRISSPNSVGSALINYDALAYSARGAANGVAPLNANGTIDSSYLPSFVDDVIEAYARTNQDELGSTWLATGSATGTVITPEVGKIYVLMNSSTNYEQNTQFRWGGTAYVQLNDSGCTSITNAEIDAIVAQ